MSETEETVREIRINPIVPSESVLVATARGMRPRDAEERIERGDKFIAIKPFASRYEWEVHILPLQHQSDFINSTDADMDDFAAVLKRTMGRLDHVIGGAQYNFFLHSQPHGEACADCPPSYHWHLEICPRTSIPTGFELGSGLVVSTITPEDAAAQLRAVELS